MWAVSTNKSSVPAGPSATHQPAPLADDLGAEEHRDSHVEQVHREGSGQVLAVLARGGGPAHYLQRVCCGELRMRGRGSVQAEPNQAGEHTGQRGAAVLSAGGQGEQLMLSAGGQRGQLVSPGC